MIHREDDTALLDDPFTMDHAKIKECSREKLGEMVAELIMDAHYSPAIRNPFSFKRPMISPTTPSTVRFELSMTCASSAMIKGEARREVS